MSRKPTSPIANGENPASPTTGGSNFTVEQAPVEAVVEEQSPVDEGLANVAVNEAIIETLCGVIGNLLVITTKVEELDFAPDEVEQLKSVWGGLLPSMSPLMTAFLCTLIIVGGKVTIYYKVKGGKKDAETEGAKKVAALPSGLPKKID